jgi:hypothetical protein
MNLSRPARLMAGTPSSIGVLLGVLVLSISQLLHLPGAPKIDMP